MNIIVVCVLLNSRLLAQFSLTQKYSCADYPALKNIFCLHIDQTGTLWIGTYSSGLIKFDGKKFTQFTVNNGLLINQVTHIQSGHDSTVWFGNYQYIGRIKDDIITFEKYADLFSIPEDQTSGMFLISKNGELWIENTIESYVRKFNFQKQIFIKEENRKIVELNKSRIFTIPSYEVQIYIKNNENLCWYNKICNLGGLISNDARDAVVYDDKVFYIENKAINLFDLNSKVKNRILTTDKYFELISLSNETVLCSERINKSIIKIYEIDRNGKVYNQYLVHSENTSKSICKDNAGNIWIGTEIGLIKINKAVLEFNSKVPNMPQSVWALNEDRDGNIWFLSDKEGLSYYDGRKVTSLESKFQIGVPFLNGSTKDHFGNIYFNSTHKGFVRINNPRNIKYIDNDSNYCFFSKKLSNNRLAFGMGKNKGLWVSQNNILLDSNNRFIKLDQSKGNKLVNILTLSEDKFQNLWMGRSSQGISVYLNNLDTVLNFLKADNSSQPGGISSCTDSKGNIWFGTDLGLFFIDVNLFVINSYQLNKSMVKVFETILGQGSINSLLFNNKKIIFGNPNGFGWIDENAFYNGIQKVSFFNKSVGYQAGGVEQNSILIDKSDNYWFGNVLSALCFNPSKYVEDSLIPIVHLIKYCDNDSCRNKLTQDFVLKEGSTTLTFYLKSYNCPYLYDNLLYKYRMNKGKWSALQSEPIITIDRLMPGRYNMEVVSVKNNYIESKPLNLSWQIKAFWWQDKRLWTLMFIASAIAAISLYVNNRILNKQKNELVIKEVQIKEKNKEVIELMQKEQILNQEKINLQIQAIVNQLNPHFIKNVLNWVQVKTYKIPEATHVIGKLGNNIEIIFRNSKKRKPYHSILDEFTLVENYLFIQKARYGDKLKFHVPDSSLIKSLEHMMLPLMAVLIHCENAAEHGIKNSIDGGVIAIDIINDQANVLITITDDGVGREAARLAGSQGTQEGTKMLYSLIEIYNQKNQNKIEMWYDDNIYTSSNGRNYGTRVNLVIPKNYEFNI